MEQRSGRIIRQGNQNPEVQIYRYVTENTFDAYLWQIVETKQKFISQIMSSKSPVRTAEDIDETALSYAEIKMLATGNPLIKEKMDLDNKVSEMKVLKQSYLSQKYAMQDSIAVTYPKEIQRLKASAAGYEKDMEFLKSQPESSGEFFCGMEVDGMYYSEKKEAGEAILKFCKGMSSPDLTPLGKYRGFSMSVSYDTFSKTFDVLLKHDMSYSVSLGTDVFGNITRLDNALVNIPKRLEETARQLENVIKQKENAEAEVSKPFAHEEELTEMMKRLDELNVLLDDGKGQDNVLDGEPEEEHEEAVSRNSQEVER